MCNVLISVINRWQFVSSWKRLKLHKNYQQRVRCVRTCQREFGHVTSCYVVINTFGGWRRVSSHKAMRAISLIK